MIRKIKIVIKLYKLFSPIDKRPKAIPLFHTKVIFRYAELNKSASINFLSKLTT